MNTCCKECTERYTACHDTCKKYLTAKKEWDERRKKIYDEFHDPFYLYKCQKIIKEEGRKW